jgi:hypothetical protein
MVATEEAEGSYANAPEEKEVGDTHNDFSFKGFGKRKRHTRDALGNYGDNPLEESKMFTEYKNFKEQELNEFWNEFGNWVTGKGYKSDKELAADKAGSGERSFKFKKGDTAKGAAINAKKAEIARTRASEFGSTMPDPEIARAHASEFGGSTKVARPKLDSILDKSGNINAPYPDDYEHPLVASPKPKPDPMNTPYPDDYEHPLVASPKPKPDPMNTPYPVAKQKPTTSAGAGSTLRGLDKGSKPVARPKPTTSAGAGSTLRGLDKGSKPVARPKTQTGLNGAHPSQSRPGGLLKPHEVINKLGFSKNKKNALPKRGPTQFTSPS